MFQSRVHRIGIAVILAVAALGARLFYVQIVRGDYYESRVEDHAMDERFLPAWRGTILDRNGVVLAQDELCFDVYVNFQSLRGTAAEWQELGRLLGLKDSEIRSARRKKHFDLAPLLQKLSPGDREFCALRISETTGWSAEETRHALRLPVLPLANLLDAASEHKTLRCMEQLALLLGRDEEDLRIELARKEQEITELIEKHWETARAWRSPRLYLRDIPREKAELLDIHGGACPGFTVRTSLQRHYPFGKYASAVVGYVGKMNAAEQEALRGENGETEKTSPEDIQIPLYFPDDLVGRTGVEKQYEEWLHGKRGVRVVEVDSSGRARDILDEIEPIPGGDIVLSIDIDLQMKAQDLLESTGFRGSLVALDARTGEIIAMATTPTFDANWFVPPAQKEELRALTENTPENRERSPMANRAIRAGYPPGSTFKMATTLAALEEGAISPAFTVNCGWGAYFHIGNKRCHHPHNEVDLLKAIQKSCNMYFYHVGERLGSDKLSRWAREFGFGAKTGVDLPGETAGIVGNREWLAQTLRQTWYPGNTVDLSIGQGFLSASPLQIAQFAATIAMDGKKPRPRVLLQKKRRNESFPAANSRHTVPLDRGHLSLVKLGMKMVAEDGGTAGAPSLGLSALRVAGKTGTAQAGRGKQDHSWFMGYAPADTPEVAFACIVEHAGHGSEYAAPIIAEWMKSYYKRRNPALLAETGFVSGECDAVEKASDAGD